MFQNCHGQIPCTFLNGENWTESLLLQPFIECVVSYIKAKVVFDQFTKQLEDREDRDLFSGFANVIKYGFFVCYIKSRYESSKDRMN